MQAAASAAQPAAAARAAWLAFAAAAATYLITLANVQYTGEEAVYTLGAYEMAWHGRWIAPTLYGGLYPRPPLYNWLIAGGAMLVGWEHVLAVARAVAALATVASGLALAFVVRRLWGDPLRAAFVATVHLTGWDILFYYGWLGYSDALFAACVQVAMLFGWLALREGRAAWMAVALAGALGGFFTKALTALVFHGVALVVVAWRERRWRQLFSPATIGLHAVAAAVLVAWFHAQSAGGAVASSMVQDVVAKLERGAGEALVQVARQALVMPLLLAGNLMPLAGVALALAGLARFRAPMRAALADPRVRTAALVAGLNFVPYWLAPGSGGRYLVPLYGLVAIVIGAALLAEPALRRIALRWIWATIALKVVLAGFALPAYTARVRQPVERIAQDVMSVVGERPLYVDDDNWLGLAVAATIDVAIAPRPPLVRPPPQFSDGFVLAPDDAPVRGRLVRAYRGTYLLCRGSACGP